MLSFLSLCLSLSLSLVDGCGEPQTCFAELCVAGHEIILHTLERETDNTEAQNTRVETTERTVALCVSLAFPFASKLAWNWRQHHCREVDAGLARERSTGCRLGFRVSLWLCLCRLCQSLCLCRCFCLRLRFRLRLCLCRCLRNGGILLGFTTKSTPNKLERQKQSQSHCQRHRQSQGHRERHIPSPSVETPASEAAGRFPSGRASAGRCLSLCVYRTRLPRSRHQSIAHARARARKPRQAASPACTFGSSRDALSTAAAVFSMESGE